jgi:hypothetical protein
MISPVFLAPVHLLLFTRPVKLPWVFKSTFLGAVLLAAIGIIKFLGELQ